MRSPRVSSSKGRGKKGFRSTLRSFFGRRSGRLVTSSLVVLVGLFLTTGLFSIFATPGFTITIDKQSGPQLSARANRTVSRWRTIGPLTSASCSTSTFNVPPSQRGSIGTSSRITLDTNADSGKYYCFEATDGDDDKAYKSSGALNFASRLVSRFVQTDTSLHSIPNLFAPVTMRTIGPLSNASCSASTFNVPASQRGSIGTSNQITLDSSDNGKYYCYELTDEWRRKTYKISLLIRIQNLPPPPVDTTPPTITTRRSGDYLIAVANETGASWRSFGPQTTTSCSASTFNVPPSQRNSIGTSARITLDSSDNGKYYCYEATDDAGNKGYKISSRISVETTTLPPPLPTDTTPPTITVEYAQNFLELSANESIASWRSFGPQTTTSCSASTFNVSGSLLSKISTSTFVTLDTSDNGKYYCFEATDSAGNKGYKSSIVLSVQPGPGLQLTVNVQQSGNVLTASSNTVRSWRSFGPQTTTSCSASTFDLPVPTPTSLLNKIGSSARITLDVADNGKYYCFEATDSAGNKGYKSSLRITASLNITSIEVTLHDGYEKIPWVVSARSDRAADWRIVEIGSSRVCTASSFSSSKKVQNRNNTSAAQFSIERTPVRESGPIESRPGDTDNQDSRGDDHLVFETFGPDAYYCLEAKDKGGNKKTYKISPLVRWSEARRGRVLILGWSKTHIGVPHKPRFDANTPANWRYVRIERNETCDNSRLESSPYRQNNKEQMTFTLTAADHLKAYCVGAYHPLNEKNYDVINTEVLYFKPPTIKTRFKNDGAEIEAYTEDPEGFGISFWWQWAGPLTSSACNQNIIRNADNTLVVGKEKSITINLDSGDHGKYYCFELSVSGVTSWKSTPKINRDVDGPAVDVARKGKTILQATASEHVTWRRSGSLTRPACTAGALSFNSSRVNYVSLKDSDHGKYYCFEATDLNGNKTYAVSSKIDVKGPELNISFVSSNSGGKSLEVSADENFYLSNKSPVDSTTRCRASLIPLRGNPVYKTHYVIILNQSHLGKYVCIAAYDSSGNSTYQATRGIVASDLPASENQINEGTSSPNTGAVDTSVIPVSAKALVGYQEALINDTYYENGWFRGKFGDIKEQYYNHLDEHFRLYTQQQSQESLNVKITLPPKLIVDGADDVERFVIEDVIYYTLVDQQDDCDRSIFSEQQVEQHADLSRFSLLLDPADDGKYYCFKVKLKVDHRGEIFPVKDQHPYRLFVTRQPIIIDGVINKEVEAFIDVKRDSDAQTISVAAIPQFAETINAQTWEHVQLSAEGESCGADAFDGNQQQGNTIPDDEDSYCFRVADDWGVYYYISEVDLEDFVGNSQSSLLMTVLTIAGIVAGVAVVGTVAVMMISIQKQKRNRFKF